MLIPLRRTGLAAAVLLLSLLLWSPLGANASGPSPHEPRSQELDPVTSATRDILGVNGIFAPDERTPVNTTSSPGAETVLLLVEWPNGAFTTCSGFMMGSRSVGTAGHCIYSHRSGGWAHTVLAVPGADGTNAPSALRTARVCTRFRAGWIPGCSPMTSAPSSSTRTSATSPAHSISRFDPAPT